MSEKSIYTSIIESSIRNIRDQIMYESDGDIVAVLGELDFIIEALDSCGCEKFIDEIASQIKEIASKEDLCPDCYGELDRVEERQVHYHLDDMPIEVFGFYECGHCKWNSKD